MSRQVGPPCSQWVAWWASHQLGGSLQPVGGHNLLEPAAVGTAIVTGPHLHNFSDIAEQLRQAQALRIAADATAVAAEIEALLADDGERERMATAGRSLVEQGGGALHRTLDLLSSHLSVIPEPTAIRLDV